MNWARVVPNQSCRQDRQNVCPQSGKLRPVIRRQNTRRRNHSHIYGDQSLAVQISQLTFSSRREAS